MFLKKKKMQYCIEQLLSLKSLEPLKSLALKLRIKEKINNFPMNVYQLWPIMNINDSIDNSVV